MNLLVNLADYLFPRVCHICGVRLGRSEKYVCSPCMSRLPRTLYHRVPDNPMEQRFMGLFPFERATGHFFYSRDSELSVLMHDLKYHRFRGLARHLGSVVANELIAAGFMTGIDVVVPVPMHFIKKARRGYNQTEEIARGISAATGIPVALNLVAVRSHRTQTSLTLDRRVRNTENLFRLKNPGEIDGRGVLLVDDVCTTGSTLTSAAQSIIKVAPGVRLSLLTLGVTF